MTKSFNDLSSHPNKIVGKPRDAQLPSGFEDTVPLLVGADSGLASAVRFIGGVVDSRMRAEGGGHGVEMVADSSRASVPGGSVHGDGPRRRDGVVTHGR